MKFWDKRDYPPIDIFVSNSFVPWNWIYKWTTTWSKTLKDAKAQFSRSHWVDSSLVKCEFKK